MSLEFAGTASSTTSVYCGDPQQPSPYFSLASFAECKIGVKRASEFTRSGDPSFLPSLGRNSADQCIT